jgi:excisionase family DNA binding protein
MSSSQSPSLETPMKAAEAAKLLGVGVSTVYRLAERNEIPHLRLGGSIRVRRSTLEAFLRNLEARSLSGGAT